MAPSWYQRLVGSAKAPGGRTPNEILVVDDQPEVRAVLREMLERLGWAVRSAAGPEEARTLMALRKDAVALALVDVIMPECDGMSLALELRRSYPRMAIVMLSGQLGEETRWVVSEEGFRFLPKPFAFAQLRDLVVELAGDPGARGSSG